MSENSRNDMTMARFARLLEIYGADTGRWPESKRVAMMHLLDQAPEARRMAAEARALDRLLALDAAGENAAADEPMDHDSLIAGALGRARRGEGKAEPASGEESSVAAGTDVLSLRRRRPGHEPTNPGEEQSTAWRSVALLAASLMLGLYLGASGGGGQLLDPLFPAGIIQVAEGDIVSELVRLGGTPIEEELL